LLDVIEISRVDIASSVMSVIADRPHAAVREAGSAWAQASRRAKKE
jgi:hypothetical protein